MLPNGYPFDLNSLYDCWKRIVRDGANSSHEKTFDPVVLQSWQRCLADQQRTAPGTVDFSAGETDKSFLPHYEFLVNAGLSHLEDCHQYLEDTKSVLALADGHGRFIHIIGDHDLIFHVSGLGVQAGARWTERYAGTNAVALCLEQAAPVQVIGAEHFYSSMHSLATTAAPVHDINGGIIAVIALITPVQDITRHALSMIMTVAKSLENSMQAQYCLDESTSRLIEMNAILGSIGDGIIVWNNEGVVTHINAQASHLLGLTIPVVQGAWIGAVMSLPEVVLQAWDKQQLLTDVETVFSVGGRSIPVLISLRPFQIGRLKENGFLLILRSIADVRRLVNFQTGTQARISFAELPVKSAAMKRVVRQARSASDSDAPVLLRGDDGVGRIQLAQAIHNEGSRTGKPFVAINCNAIPMELMATELLGSGSGKDSPGQPSKFELADGGTLLLDRVETLSHEMQSALVHLIENGTVLRLKSHEPIAVNVRIIALTSADMEKLVAEGSFSRRLYYNFFVFSIVVPALRGRPEDIRFAAERCLARLSQQRGQQLVFDDTCLKTLETYHWPGNLRELEISLEQAAGQCQGGIISRDDLPDAVRSGRLFAIPTPAHQVLTARDAQREAIKRAAWLTGGKVGAMADMLGLSRTTLWRRLNDLDISIKDYRQR